MDNSVDEVDKFSENSGEKRVIGIFAKQPVAGQVKTRLCPPLDFPSAADLYQVSLRETVTRVASRGEYQPVIFYSGDRCWFAEAFPAVRLQAQHGKDLGERMTNAFSVLFSEGVEQVLLIGSDTPDLPLDCLDQAFEGLSSRDVVFGPAEDGGYYLIGLSAHHPELFCDVSWSTPEVLQQSCELAEQLNLTVKLLKNWSDLDDHQSLTELLDRSPASETARFIKEKLYALLA